MAKRVQNTADQVIAAIKGSGGIKATIANRLGVSRWTVDNYLARWKKVNDAYEEERESITDLAETKLIKEINDGNFPAIKFYLSTKGRDRGYVERQEQHIEANISGGLVILPPKENGHNTDTE